MNAISKALQKAAASGLFRWSGVSVPSGIRIFEEENGLYAREYDGLTAEMLLSHSFFCLHPDIFYDFYKKHMVHPEARPNVVHIRLAEMERAGKVTAVVTQNIDGLHKKAGSRNVFELHGSVCENFCMGCGRRFGLDFVMHAPGVPPLPGLRRYRASGSHALR